MPAAIAQMEQALIRRLSDLYCLAYRRDTIGSLGIPNTKIPLATRLAAIQLFGWQPTSRHFGGSCRAAGGAQRDRQTGHIFDSHYQDSSYEQGSRLLAA